MEYLAWYADNSGSKAHPVGQKQTNELGLFDMTGNVWEWCDDWYAQDYYQGSPASNPKGPSSGSLRVGRGGSCLDFGRYCRPGFRGSFTPGSRGINLGFRIVFVP